MVSAIYGSIIYKDKSYPFFLDEHRVTIVGAAWEYYDDFRNADEEESISGVTADNRQILFLKCRFGFSSLQQKVWFSPVGYVLSSGNVGDPYNFIFDQVSFYSDGRVEPVVGAVDVDPVSEHMRLAVRDVLPAGEIGVERLLCFHAAPPHFLRSAMAFCSSGRFFSTVHSSISTAHRA